MKNKPQIPPNRRIQDDVDELLDNDHVFMRNHRSLRNSLTNGVINSRTFNAVRPRR